MYSITRTGESSSTIITQDIAKKIGERVLKKAKEQGFDKRTKVDIAAFATTLVMAEAPTGCLGDIVALGLISYDMIALAPIMVSATNEVFYENHISETLVLDSVKQKVIEYSKNTIEVWLGMNEIIWGTGGVPYKYSQRAVWRNILIPAMEKIKHARLTAELVTNTLQDNPLPVVKSGDNYVSRMICALDESVPKNNRNYEFTNKLTEVFQKYQGMDSFSVPLQSGDFNIGDLFYAIHGYWFELNATKINNTENLYSVRVIINDINDYEEFKMELGSFSTILGWVANDVAYISEKLGAMSKFNVKIEFNCIFDSKNKQIVSLYPTFF